MCVAPVIVALMLVALCVAPPLAIALAPVLGYLLWKTPALAPPPEETRALAPETETRAEAPELEAAPEGALAPEGSA